MPELSRGSDDRNDAPPAWIVGLVWSLVVAVMWAALAIARPTTTWHLAPLILAVSLPLMVVLDGVSDVAMATRKVLAAGGLTFVVTVAEALVLTVADRMQGPGALGGQHATIEAVVLAVVGAGLGVVVGLLWVRRQGSRRHQ